MRLFFLLLCLSLSPPAFVQAKALTLTAATPDTGWQRAEAQFRASFFYATAHLALLDELPAQAEMLLKRAADADPNSLLLWRELGSLSEDRGNALEAERAWRKTLELAPKDAEARRRLAQALLFQKKNGEARALYRQTDGSDLNDLESSRMLAAMDVSELIWKDAIRRLRDVLRLAPGDLDQRELLAACLEKDKQRPEALRQLLQVLVSDASRVATWIHYAATLDEAGQADAALEVYSEGWVQNSDSLPLTNAFARALVQHGRHQEADALFTKLLAHDGADAPSLYSRGMTRLRLKRYVEAEADMRELGRVAPESPGYLYGLGQALLAQGKNTEAERVLLQFAELRPEVTQAWAQLALLYDRQGKGIQSRKLLQRALKKVPGSTELQLLLGAAHHDLKEHKESEEVYRKGLASAPEQDAVFRFQLAILYEKTKRFPLAEKELRLLLDKKPKDARALNYLGYSMVERNTDLPEALALIQRAVAEEPDNFYYLDSLGWAYYKLDRPIEAEAPLRRAALGVEAGFQSDEAIILEHYAEILRSLKRDAEADTWAVKAKNLRKRPKGNPGPLPKELP